MEIPDSIERGLGAIPASEIQGLDEAADVVNEMAAEGVPEQETTTISVYGHDYEVTHTIEEKDALMPGSGTKTVVMSQVGDLDGRGVLTEMGDSLHKPSLNALVNWYHRKTHSDGCGCGSPH